MKERLDVTDGARERLELSNHVITNARRPSLFLSPVGDDDARDG
jgi:hypothetical protein